MNIWAILLSAIASMVIGSVWYGPLFGKIFISEMGFKKMTPKQQKEMKKSMIMLYLVQFIASLVMFYTIAWFIGSLNRLSVMGGLQVACITWIGIVVPLKLGDAIWGGKMKLFCISISNLLVTLLAAGVIIGAFG